jgi:malonyl CoA-acyl carrier protein transacylase
MGGDILGRFPAADDLVRQAGDWLGYDVPAVCLGGSGRKVVPPRQEAQVIYIISCAYAAVLRRLGYAPAFVCGHSLGSWAAGHVAGVYDFLTGLDLLTRVEDWMESLIPPDTQGMGVVIGLPEERVRDLCGSAGEVYLANVNSQGQYVIAGKSAAVARVLAEATQAGAYKVKRLPTGRAMHTPLVREVSDRLAQALADVPLAAPTAPLVSCHDGRLLMSAEAVRGFFSGFLALPVHWQTAQVHILAERIRTFLEVGPATVLTDLMVFIDRTVRVRTASDLLHEVPTE